MTTNLEHAINYVESEKARLYSLEKQAINRTQLPTIDPREGQRRENHQWRVARAYSHVHNALSLLKEALILEQNGDFTAHEPPVQTVQEAFEEYLGKGMVADDHDDASEFRRDMRNVTRRLRIAEEAVSALNARIIKLENSAVTWSVGAGGGAGGGAGNAAVRDQGGGAGFISIKYEGEDYVVDPATEVVKEPAPMSWGDRMTDHEVLDWLLENDCISVGGLLGGDGKVVCTAGCGCCSSEIKDTPAAVWDRLNRSEDS